jgi:hypothetical protein
MVPKGLRSESTDRVVEIREKPILVERWRRLLLVREMILHEGAAIELVIYDFRGRKLGGPYGVASGSGWAEEQMVLLPKARRIFLGQTSGHVMIGPAYLLNENGHIVRRVYQPSSSALFGHSDDERILWIIGLRLPHDPDEASAVVDLVVVDSHDGRQVARVEAKAAESATVQWKEKQYVIPLKKPSP